MGERGAQRRDDAGDVLVAERNLLIAESSLASSNFSLRNDLVNIYAAAGGGWDD